MRKFTNRNIKTLFIGISLFLLCNMILSQVILWRFHGNSPLALFILYSFNSVNTLVSVLNAHIENEFRTKEFLKDTISDISHQLKTPLAALNIYNGILQITKS